MNVTQEQIFQHKQTLQREIETYEKQLQEMVTHQGALKSIEQLAVSIVKYNEIERQIEDRAHVFSLLSSPPESLLSPYIKSELFSYFVSAETVSADLVNFLVDDVLVQARLLIESGEDDVVELVQAEFKEYILPGKIIAERFNELEPLLEEMNRYCMNIDTHYNPDGARRVLRYAFEMALNADIRLDPVIQVIREMPMKYMIEEDRAFLLDAVEERLASLRYEETKKHNVSMERAVKIMEHREAEEDMEKTPIVDEEE